MNQQMFSYCQGMHQMMQKNNSGMASLYGQMTKRMQSLLSELPEDTTSAQVSPEGSVAVPDGSVIFASNCASCHGADGAGISGVFPPLDGSAVVTGDKETLAKILLDGLQGAVSVAGGHYNGMMPAFGNTLSDAQIAAVLTYVRSMPDNKAGNITTGEVQNIRKETNSRRQPWTPGELGLK
jgi:cbb3-type cytochrome c oxidase subunit III